MTQMLMANMELRLRLLPSSLWNMASVTSQWRPRYPSLQWHEYRDGEWATHVPWRHGRLAQSVYTHTLPTAVSLVMWPGGHLCRKGDSNVKRRPALGSASVKRSADFWPKVQNLSWDCKNKSLSSQTSSFRFQGIQIPRYTTLTDEKKRGVKEKRKSCRGPSVYLNMRICFTSVSCFSAGCTADTHYGYPIAVKSLTLALSLEITARTLSGPAEFKGAAETPTVPAVTHYSIRLTQQ